MVTASVTYLRGLEENVSRTARLLELLVRVQTKPRFTAAELAEKFGVSRRTMLRDLRVLSEMGIPLRSTPGPGGGYSLPRGGTRLSPSLTVDEALALIVSYEALMRYPVSPFSSQSLSAVTKLRAALPPDVVGELDRLRRHVAVVEPVREYEAPLLGELLAAALDEAHLKVTYDSIKSGVSERVIFPFGLYASQGFWYSFCLDYRREQNVSLRADHRSLPVAINPPGPQRVPVRLPRLSKLSVTDAVTSGRDRCSTESLPGIQPSHQEGEPWNSTNGFLRSESKKSGVVVNPCRRRGASARRF